MNPDQKKIIASAHLKLKQTEKRLAPLFVQFEAGLNSELGIQLMHTLHSLIPSYVAGEIFKDSLHLFIEFIADELGVSRDAAEALADYKVATYEFGLALRFTDPVQSGDRANG